MKDEKFRNVYFTNMEENDPIIDKFMDEYIEKIAKKGKIPKADDLIVNFEITYADGTNKSYTCGSESCVFGNTENFDIQKEYDDESASGSKIIDNDNIKDDLSISASLEFEEDKWDNCKDEWSEYIKKCNCYQKENEEKEEVQKKTGQITVYSILKDEENTKLKGVKINLYRINGLCPVLIETKVTDVEGKVVFCNVEDGNYRVIEFIDKTYFDKPSYVKWNEVTIDKCNKESTIYVINSIR